MTTELSNNAACKNMESHYSTYNTLGFNDELHILSWNIQKTNNSNWEQDLAALGNDTHLDLAFIQEAVLEANLSDAISSQMHETFAPGYQTRNRSTGVMTLSANTPNVACNLSNTEPWLNTPKATSIVEYSLREREENLLTINLHAINFTLGTREFQRQFSALEEIIAQHQGPIIIAGDLNTWSAKRQQVVDEFMARYELSPVGFQPDHRSKVFGRALDHIYVRGMFAQSAEVILVSSSDHNPLRVTLQITPKAELH